MTETNEQNGLPELPKGWAFATIGNLISTGGIFIDGDWIESKDQDPNGDVRLIQLADVGDGFYRNKSSRFLTSQKANELNCTFLEIGDVLLARMPDPLGRTCIFLGDSKKAITVVDVCIIRTGENSADSKWLMYAINSSKFRAEIAELQSGSTRKRISRGNLATLKLPVPPLNEQARIVAKIEELFTKLDAGVDALKQIQKQIKRYRQAVLRDAVTGELTIAWRKENQAELEPAADLLKRILTTRRERWEQEQTKKFAETGKTPKNDDWKKKYKEPTAPVIENLHELPSSWARINVGLIIDDLKYGTSQKCGYDTDGVPVLRIPNVSNGIIDHSDLKYAKLPKMEYEQLKLTSGDILLIRSNGSVSLVGKTALVKESEKDFAYAGYLIRLRLSSNFIQPNFLQTVLSTNDIRAQIEMPARSTSGVNNINSDEVKALRISLPPLAEQQRIVEEVERLLSVADAVEATVKQSLKQAERLRQSILKRAFEGNLVPQDDTDEPAQILLERIKQEREEKAAESKSKKIKAGKPEAKTKKAAQSNLPFQM